MSVDCPLPQIPNDGHRSWSMSRDKRGYRTYTIVHRVQVERGVHGPAAVIDTPGLPEPGSLWTEPTIIDPWVYFTQDMKIEPVGDPARSDMFDVTQTATNEPSTDCAEEGKDDPLQIADRVRVESVDTQEEMIYDANEDEIVNSAYEQYRGHQVENEDFKLRVIIEQNVATLELDLIQSLLKKTNDAELWGFPAGQVRFSKFEANPNFYTNCEKYITRRLTFDIDEDGFVVDLLDESTKVLHGRWDQATGTGCTVTITVTGGAITGGSIGAAGSGYPTSAIIPLKVAGGTGGIVLVESDATGAISGFTRVHLPGSGYTAGTKATTQRGKWVLLKYASGEVPTPDNPQHFDRPGDIKGQNTRFILDGRGMPIDENEEPGNNRYYRCSQTNLLLLGLPIDIELP